MLTKLRKHVNATTIVAFIALIFATTGGAFAMNTGASPSKPTASAASVASGPGGAIAAKSKAKAKTKAGPRGPAGKNGANGAPGPAGATGPQGPAGAAGAKGETGAAGAAGTNGTNGTNGKEGKEGIEGSPWTAGGTLPKEKTETGAWTYTGWGAGAVSSEISFPIPLATALDQGHVHYVGPSETTAACPGSHVKPEAEPGNLCVYQTEANSVKQIENVKLEKLAETIIVSSGQGFPGAGTSGATVIFTATGHGLGFGTWAVTAP